MAESRDRLHVSLVAVPEVMASALVGLYEVMSAFDLFGSFDEAVPRQPPFTVEIVGLGETSMRSASGLAFGAHRSFESVARSDIVITPSMLVEQDGWVPGRYPALVDWLRKQHAQGAMLCSACSGVLLLAETGLLDGRETTLHWAYASTFRRNFPAVTLRLDEVLVAAGERHELVMAGGSASWHDLVLYLIARHVGPAAAQAIAKFMLLQWHRDGQALYVAFDPPMDHGDAVVLKLQQWLRVHLAGGNPVEEMARRSGLPSSSFKRRFTKATGYSPIAYVQHARIEEAKRRLERGSDPIEEICWAVGYEDAAFFRRLFKRITRVTPGEYRRKLRVPRFADDLAD